MDKNGRILKVIADPEALFEALKEHCLCPERIIPETGKTSETTVFPVETKSPE
jgi:hypothetical protein